MPDLNMCPACQASAQNEIGDLRWPPFLFGPAGIVPWLRRRSVPFRWAFRYLRARGPGFVLRKTLSVGEQAVQRKFASCAALAWKTPAVEHLALGLKPGEWVEVKSLEEILATLDSKGKTHGLSFTNEMKLHCGKRYRVFKRVESIFNEFSREQRRVRNTVLLDSVFCRGEGLGCDRSCFHMWREAWLRRVDGPAVERVATVADSRFRVLNHRPGDE
jgi:hypothetical protein